MLTPVLLILCVCISSVFPLVPDHHLTGHQHGGSPSSHTTNHTNSHPESRTGVLDKTDSTQRACPNCLNNDCNTQMTMSGLPFIQVLIALAAGIIWAKIFVWIFKNFYEKGNSDEPGPQYGVPAPQYGVPMTQYGVPMTQYGVPMSSYGAPSSRAFNFDFLTLTKNVLKAINDFSNS